GLLHDDGDADVERVAGRAQTDGLAAIDELAGVRHDVAGDDLRQGRLTRTVGAEQAVYFPGQQLEAGTLQGPGAIEGLDDARGGKQQRLGFWLDARCHAKK